MQTSTVPFALAVDDDALIRLDACEILEEAGFRCLDAESGDAAIVTLTDKWEQIVVLLPTSRCRATLMDSPLPGSWLSAGLT